MLTFSTSSVHNFGAKEKNMYLFVIAKQSWDTAVCIHWSFYRRGTGRQHIVTRSGLLKIWSRLREQWKQERFGKTVESTKTHISAHTVQKMSKYSNHDSSDETANKTSATWASWKFNIKQIICITEWHMPQDYTIFYCEMDPV